MAVDKNWLREATVGRLLLLTFFSSVFRFPFPAVVHSCVIRRRASGESHETWTWFCVKGCWSPAPPEHEVPGELLGRRVEF